MLFSAARRRIFAGLIFSSLLPCAPHAGAQDEAAPRSASADDTLRNYVHEPDPAYSWKVVRQVEGNPASIMTVRLVSQRWRSEPEVNRSLWEHWLVIVRPERVTSDTAFLLIGGGSNQSKAPEKADPITMKIAEATGSVVAELKMVPNQPLIFHEDGRPRSEDDLIGYAWAQYLETGDATWLPRLPMVKSAVRAMDCITEVMASDQGGNIPVRSYVVAGGSKRGWTTWMTGAADPRVKAIVPIVIDVLNVETSMKHHAQVYGFWAEAIGNYYQHGIMQRWGDEKLRDIYRIVDPFFHRERLTMPKYIVNAAGDQFFLPDSSQFYFDQLEGEKYLRYVPNADHSLRGSDAAESIAAFYHLILTDKPRPRFEWQFQEDGAIRVTAADAPDQVKLWTAHNAAARDFRLKTIGPRWSSKTLAADADGSYVAHVAAPPQGWSAFFVELSYDVGLPVPLKVTTAVRITPNTLPHADVDLRQVPYEAQLKREAAGQ